MLCNIEYKDSTGIVRSWLLVKYQVLNNCKEGIYLSDYYGKPEILYEYSKPGCDLFFDDKKYEIMKNAGYFIGCNTKHLGEGGVEITEKTKEELLLEQIRLEKEKQSLLHKGYKLFKSSEVLSNEFHNAHHYFNRENYKSGVEWESDVNGRQHYILRVHGLYLVPRKEIQNVKLGTLLVSSIDAKEIVYDGDLNWKIENGFSQYGIRLMPTYYDELLLCGNQNPSVT